MKTKIAIACDDLGFETKEALKNYLIEEKNAEIVYDPVKIPEDGVNTFAVLANEIAEVIQRDKCRLGIYIWVLELVLLVKSINIGELERQL